MAIRSADSGVAPIAHDWRRALLGVGAGVAVVVVLVAIAALLLSGATLASDESALARVSVQPLGGRIEGIQAFGAHGHSIPLAVHDGLLTPLRRLTPGAQVSVDVKVRRPGWIGWALGSEHTVRLTLHTPLALLSERWMTVPTGSNVRVSFSEPVDAVSYYGASGGVTHRVLSDDARSVSLGRQPATGATEIAVAPRPWETLGAPQQVSWFPPSSSPVMATIPAAGDDVSPTAPIYLTFSKPVSEVLGEGHPQLSPNVPGHWREANSHTLVFTPSGFGAPLESQVRVRLPSAVAVSGTGGGLSKTNQVAWNVPPGSTLRLQQLLAETGYLPVDWHPSGAPVARTPSAQAQAAVDPPKGAFTWRYPNTPGQLQALWTPGQWNVVTKGAVMKFENENNLEVDGEAGPAVWSALLRYVLADRRLHEPYSYVYVHREVPETMTLWSAGRIVETSAANTGISGAETELGTFPVFEHIEEGTMSGTNPDGSHYEDPGIKWISYFNGGDALHYFDRASFGFQQSLGCVELPLEAAAEEWPYTPIGTLVTVET